MLRCNFISNFNLVFYPDLLKSQEPIEKIKFESEVLNRRKRPSDAWYTATTAHAWAVEGCIALDVSRREWRACLASSYSATWTNESRSRCKQNDACDTWSRVIGFTHVAIFLSDSFLNFRPVMLSFYAWLTWASSSANNPLHSFRLISWPRAPELMKFHQKWRVLDQLAVK
jgi:hypothetical protein